MHRLTAAMMAWFRSRAFNPNHLLGGPLVGRTALGDNGEVRGIGLVKENYPGPGTRPWPPANTIAGIRGLRYAGSFSPRYRRVPGPVYPARPFPHVRERMP